MKGFTPGCIWTIYGVITGCISTIHVINEVKIKQYAKQTNQLFVIFSMHMDNCCDNMQTTIRESLPITCKKWKLTA